MKKLFFALAVMTVFYSCDKDHCDEGYKPHNSNGQEICIPEYLNGKASNFKLGNTYIHDKHGLIRLKNGIWINELNQVIIVN